MYISKSCLVWGGVTTPNSKLRGNTFVWHKLPFCSLTLPPAHVGPCTVPPGLFQGWRVNVGQKHQPQLQITGEVSPWGRHPPHIVGEFKEKLGPPAAQNCQGCQRNRHETLRSQPQSSENHQHGLSTELLWGHDHTR